MIAHTYSRTASLCPAWITLRPISKLKKKKSWGCSSALPAFTPQYHRNKAIWSQQCSCDMWLQEKELSSARIMESWLALESKFPRIQPTVMKVKVWSSLGSFIKTVVVSFCLCWISWILIYLILSFCLSRVTSACHCHLNIVLNSGYFLDGIFSAHW